MKNSVLFGLKITDLKKSLNLFLVVVIALTGDSIVNNYTFPFWPLLLKCLTDSSTHFLIAAFSWNYVVISAVNNKSQLAASFLCGLFASSIDVDHFISSGSISLQVKLNYMLNYWYIVTNFKLGLNISISKTNFTLYNYFNNFGSSSGYAFHKKAVHKSLETCMVDSDCFLDSSLERWIQAWYLDLPHRVYITILILSLPYWTNNITSSFKIWFKVNK